MLFGMHARYLAVRLLSLTSVLFSCSFPLLVRAGVAAKPSSSTLTTDKSDSSASNTEESESSVTVSSTAHSASASHSDHPHISSDDAVSPTAPASSSVTPTRSFRPSTFSPSPDSSPADTDDTDDTDDDLPTQHSPTHGPTNRPTRPPPFTDHNTRAPLPTQQHPTPTSRSKHTVIAVVTVIVDGSASLSSETSVSEDVREDIGGVLFTSTVVENGSVVLVTGNLGDSQNANSGAML
ncbi:hypothetical protein GGH95_004810, partial [Coemansia sp. RSA 1836]